MKNLRTYLNLTVACFVLAGCTSLYQGTVTFTKVVKAAQEEYAILYNDGLVSAPLHEKVSQAHDKWRVAAGIGKRALQKYKETGDQSQYVAALEGVREAATGFVNLVVPLLTTSKAEDLKKDLSKATDL